MENRAGANQPPSMLRRVFKGSKSLRVRSVIERMESARSITKIFSPSVVMRDGAPVRNEVDASGSDGPMPRRLHMSDDEAEDEVMGTPKLGPLCTVAVLSLWRWAVLSFGFRSWSLRSHHSRAWRRNGEDMDELMELQRVVLGDLDRQLNSLAAVLGGVQGGMAVEQVAGAVRDPQWRLVVEELNALLDVLQARVSSLQGQHAAHIQWTRRTRACRHGFELWRDRVPRSTSLALPGASGGAAGVLLAKLCGVHAVRRTQALTRGFTIWMAASCTAPHLALVAQGNGRHHVYAGLARVSRERVLQRGYARWVEYTTHALGQRLWRLEQERGTRHTTERESEITALSQQLSEALVECRMLSARDVNHSDAAMRDAAIACSLKDKIARHGAAALLRMIAASWREHLKWAHDQWHLYALRAAAARCQRAASQHQGQVMTRAAERMVCADDRENQSPTVSIRSGASGHSEPLLKAIHLRQRLQGDHTPRARAAPEHPPVPSHEGHSRVAMELTPRRSKPLEPEQGNLRGSASKKGALLRGLRARLEQ